MGAVSVPTTAGARETSFVGDTTSAACGAVGSTAGTAAVSTGAVATTPASVVVGVFVSAYASATGTIKK
jgi:hypothetical protein